MKKRTVPHTYIILFILLFVACLMTYLIPSGEFERVFDEKSAQTLVVAGSYHEVTATPVAPYSVFNKIFEAATLSKTASLAAFILLIGGAFEVIMKTGSLTALCESTLMRMKRFELWFIPIFVCLFSVFGFTMGLTTASTHRRDRNIYKRTGIQRAFWRKREGRFQKQVGYGREYLSRKR